MPIYYLDSGSIDRLEVSASLLVSGSQRILGSGSGILTVTGSQGGLFSINEKNAANPALLEVEYLGQELFSVNDDKSTRISGSLIVTGSITGSLLGTASFATTASYALAAAVASINVSAGTTSNNLSNLVFSNANGVSFGLNAGTITATINPSGLVPASYYFNLPIFQGSGNTLSLGGSSNWVQPFILPYDVSFSYLRLMLTNSFGSTTVGTTANATNQLNQTQTWFANIYTAGTGASSKSLQRIAGSSATMAMAIRHTCGTGTAAQTLSYDITYPATGNYSTYNTSYNPGNTIALSTTQLTQFSGNRYMDIPFATSLAAGNYWIAFQRSSATAITGAGNTFSGATHQNSFYYATQINSNFQEYGVSATTGTIISTSPVYLGLGSWSTNTLGATSVSLALSNISTLALNPIVPFQLIRQA